MKRLILELGLRFRPTARDALEGHQAKLAALMLDLADIPPEALERAIRAWVQTRRFMPMAVELIEMARESLAKGPGGQIDWVTRGNASLREIGRSDIHWVRDEGGQIRLEWKAQPAAGAG